MANFDKSIYDTAIANGESPQFAELLASRRVLTGLTDKQYFAKQYRSLGDDLGEDTAAEVAAEAKRHGYTPHTGDTYLPNIARFKGDPNAFVSPADGRAKIRKAVEMQGAHCTGGLAFEWPKPDTDPLAPESIAPLPDDIVREGVREIITENPDAAKEKPETLRRAAIKKYSPIDSKER